MGGLPTVAIVRARHVLPIPRLPRAGLTGSLKAAGSLSKRKGLGQRWTTVLEAFFKGHAITPLRCDRNDGRDYTHSPFSVKLEGCFFVRPRKSQSCMDKESHEKASGSHSWLFSFRWRQGTRRLDSRFSRAAADWIEHRQGQQSSRQPAIPSVRWPRSGPGPERGAVSRRAAGRFSRPPRLCHTPSGRNRHRRDWRGPGHGPVSARWPW